MKTDPRHRSRPTLRPAPGRSTRLALLALLLLTARVAAGQAQAVPAPDAGELRVTLLHTSDEHSALLPEPLVEYRPGEPSAARGGIARLATVVRRVRAERAARGEPVLLTSAGDNLTGTPFGWLALEGQAPELGLLTELGYDAVTLGNHEFDYGSERLAAYLAAAGYPAAARRTALVAANTRAPPGHPLAERGIERTRLVELPNGLRVGFFGLLGREAARFVTLAAPVEFTDAHEVAAVAVAELRAAGAHLVVALTHAGLEADRALARAVPGIDVILGGHDHLLLEEPHVEAGTPIVHPGAHLKHVAQLELGVDPRTGAVRVRNPETGAPYNLPLDGRVAEDPATAARVDAYRQRLDRLFAELSGGRVDAIDRTVMRSRFSLPAGPPHTETGLGNFVTDAMRHAAAAATGEPVDFAFQANGVLRQELAAGASEWNRGRIVAYDLARVVGMGTGPDGRPGYPLVAVRLTGEEVRRVLEVSTLLSGMMRNSYFLQVSGLRARYDPARAVWLRLPVRGTPIPSGRAVLDVQREAEDGWVPLERGDTTLYHVVTDYYVASFLPMVGRVVPGLALVPRDRTGAPLDDIDRAIVRRDGEALGIWQAVVEFAAAQPPSADGEPWVPDSYAAPAGRLERARGTPLWTWPAAGLLLLVVAFVALLRLRGARSRRRAASA